MKGILGTVMAIALSFMLACGALGIGFYHLEIARAEEALMTFDTALADRIYARLEKMVDMGKNIPWIFERVRSDLQVCRNRVSYWRRDYTAILEKTASIEKNKKIINPSLYFIRANARYRSITGEESREKVIRDLDQSIRDYAGTIDADPMFEDAAFNYEFLVMLRNNVVTDGQPIPLMHQSTQMLQDQMKSVHGGQGAEPGFKIPQQIKILVPMEDGEDPQKRGPEPGKGSATKRRG
ncbi:MAG TPA: hypothetical protein PLA74_02860 [Syntrophales bacterium]|nr:hypothetical protein [Syntrophales bacterium]HPQ43479.1 hypothetical protein [Syntrophales bacterium]